MSLNQKLTRIYIALNGIQGAKVYHYAKAASAKAPYVVWQEDATNEFKTGNRRGEYQVHGTIDIFSSKEFDALFDDVPAALDGIASVNLNSVQYEDDTKLIHYEYEFWVG